MSDKILNLIRSGLICLLLPGLALAQHDAGIPQIEDIEGLYQARPIRPTPSALSQVSFTGAKRTCTPGYPSMPACSVIPLVTKKRTASRAAKR